MIRFVDFCVCEYHFSRESFEMHTVSCSARLSGDGSILCIDLFACGVWFQQLQLIRRCFGTIPTSSITHNCANIMVFYNDLKLNSRK